VDSKTVLLSQVSYIAMCLDNHVTTPKRPHYEHSKSTNYTLNTTKAAQKMITATEQDLDVEAEFRAGNHMMKFTFVHIYLIYLPSVCPICANRFNAYRLFNYKIISILSKILSGLKYS
jgi:hypothetical protein